MIDDAVQAKLDEIDTLLAERLHLRGPTLAAKVRKAGRLLPRAVSREAAYLAEAQQFAQAPKLARRIDETRLETAHRTVAEYLRTVDPAERLKDRILGILGIVAFNILLFGGLFIYYLWSQGIV
ncbi:hypothetical protein JQU17_10460 [Ponticoccus sp. SC2-23]|uniref:hypothetical protein n=1 Tax=Alexandriicola marinus TaxID=2081710 RepID=UPI000FD9C931|nr:hypothetical protein [Alexandriicola marinus]MBM1219886.1 hypothetical protein [Ponticoccus sp. SC6-9]MBM1224572.1 hypothetical protein [Ponticoccus sp. SC6-15]MBM1228085.1 hypothetical protein [Ponticoccus sp. SC6-38]MBM1234277.1 hypothetical protein [Ponticoccus sp. SC6-45]MBM1238587.1 hypothetical protein [Ponticoccus sp. SC6-49]MBM1242368.1 hypothetical protein [Ponticoccus sp. SC2-64]MBM1247801.1 hypothetical protein [Ponticoccus sp. SC6-42]MBM1251540.1 hypothetical protein [Pontico